MGGAHSHRHGSNVDAGADGAGKLLLLGGIAVAVLAALIGLFVLWPDSEDLPDPVAYGAEGVQFVDAEVVDVAPACPAVQAGPSAPAPEPTPDRCNELTARVDGQRVTVTGLQPYVAESGLRAGDDVRLAQIPNAAGPDGQPAYGFVGIKREFPLGLLTVVFVLAVAIVARLRGILALVGLGLAGLVVARFMLPALLAGESGIGVALVGSTLIMTVVLYLAHGPSVRTSTALAGTLIGVAITALLGVWVVGRGRFSGVGDETGEFLLAYAPDLNVRGLLTSAIIIAGLGVLNDVTITQSSAVWELRTAAPEMSRARIFASAMRIGRDHIASTIYTIVFAYAGTALAVLMLLALYDRSLLESLVDESIAEEAARTLTSAIGLVLAVPVTTAIAAATVNPPKPGQVATSAATSSRDSS